MSNFFCWSRCVAFCVAAVAGLATISDAAVISVNFQGGNGNTTTANGPGVTTTAGAVRAGNFNNFSGVSGSTAVNGLLDSNGVGAATLSFGGTSSGGVTNVYGATPTGPGTSGGAGDTALMTGYLDNFSNAGSFVTVSGLGAAFTANPGGYMVLVYQNGDSNGSFGYTATDNASHTVTAYGLQTGGNGGNYPLAGGAFGYIGSSSTSAAGPATAANEVILTGLTGSSFTLSGNLGSTGDGRARINGFQIVTVPEPATMSLMGLGTLALLARRRHRA